MGERSTHHYEASYVHIAVEREASEIGSRTDRDAQLVSEIPCRRVAPGRQAVREQAADPSAGRVEDVE